MYGQRPGGSRVDVVIELAAPDLTAGVRIDRIRDRGAVREVHGEAVGRCRLVRTDAHGRSDTGLRVIAPVLTATLRVERDHVAVVAGDEEPAAEDCGLRARVVDAGEAVGPFQFQTGYRGGVETSLRGRLKACIRGARAPPVPSCVERRGLERRRLRGAVADDRRRWRRAHRTTGEEGRDRASLDISQ